MSAEQNNLANIRVTYLHCMGIAPRSVLGRLRFQQSSPRFLLIFTHMLLTDVRAFELEPDVMLDGSAADWDGKTKRDSVERGQDNCSSKKE